MPAKPASRPAVEIDLALHPRQRAALFSQATEILYGGAAGGGKSHLMRVAAILFSSAIPGLQTYLFRRTHPELVKNHMEGPSSFPSLLAPWLEKKLVKINYSDLTVEFTFNGAKVYLCHCQHEKDLTKYQGAEIHLLLPDELTHFSANQYRFLRGRVRLGGLVVPDPYKGLFPRILAGTNPGGIGHNWVKSAFVDQAEPMAIREMSKAEGGMRRQYVPARLSDNPTLIENDPDYASRLEGLGDPALIRAMLDGDWDIVSGGMFDDLWKREKHVIEPFAVPASWYVDRSFDWGSSKPFSVGWWAESDGTTAPNGRTYQRGTLFRIHEYYGWNGRPNEGCKMLATEVADKIKEIEAGFPFRVNPGPADDAIWDEENGNCIARDMAERGVIWTRAGKRPGTRKTGWEKLRARLKAATQFPMEEPGLFIFHNCAQFIRTVPVLPRDQKQTDDVDTDAEDHIADEARYRILQVSAGHAY